MLKRLIICSFVRKVCYQFRFIKQKFVRETSSEQILTGFDWLRCACRVCKHRVSQTRQLSLDMITTSSFEHFLVICSLDFITITVILLQSSKIKGCQMLVSFQTSGFCAIVFQTFAQQIFLTWWSDVRKDDVQSVFVNWSSTFPITKRKKLASNKSC